VLQCTVLQCVAVSQCVAVCCSVLQCVAVSPRVQSYIIILYEYVIKTVSVSIYSDYIHRAIHVRRGSPRVLECACVRVCMCSCIHMYLLNKSFFLICLVDL